MHQVFGWLQAKSTGNIRRLIEETILNPLEHRRHVGVREVGGRPGSF